MQALQKRSAFKSSNIIYFHLDYLPQYYKNRFLDIIMFDILLARNDYRRWCRSLNTNSNASLSKSKGEKKANKKASKKTGGSSKWALKKQIAFLTALEYILELSCFMDLGSACLMLHSKSVLYEKKECCKYEMG